MSLTSRDTKFSLSSPVALINKVLPLTFSWPYQHFAIEIFHSDIEQRYLSVYG